MRHVSVIKMTNRRRLIISCTVFVQTVVQSSVTKIYVLLFPKMKSNLVITHTPVNGPLSRTTQVSQYQKVKTNLDFTEARDSEWQWHQLGHMQVCTSLQTENHASTPSLSFLQAWCPSCHPTNSVKALEEHNLAINSLITCAFRVHSQKSCLMLNYCVSQCV